MLSLFGSVSGIFKSRAGKIRVDSSVFKLHYRATVAILVGSCIMITAGQFIGDPIHCLTDKLDLNQYEKAVNTYCWISSTFSMPEDYDKEVGVEVPFPGVGPWTPGQPKKHHAYYQWVPFVLFLQAIMFYIPHWLWKCFEGGRLQVIILGLNAKMLKEDEELEKLKTLARYLKENINMHNLWFMKYMLCEVLLFVNVVWNIFFTDIFLGHEFSEFGIEALKYLDMDQEDRLDPLTRVFPRVTKCTFYLYGPSGTIQQQDTMCILAWNILNEKVYTFLWFWFVILSVITAWQLLYRLASVLFKPLRVRMLKGLGRARDPRHFSTIVDNCNVGDWFLVCHLGKHMDPVYYADFITVFSKALDKENIENLEMRKVREVKA